MSYQALARKYRPQRFSDIIGQETVVRTLKNAIEQKRIHHAYLFSGVRGIGKTTVARILAKALNCVSGPATEPDNTCTICREITEGIDMDVREIDAATYTGVDSIRDLRDVTQFQPARDRYRTFIIDEAHMLSQGAWNALLKLIEEPPEHVIFMFATTEMQKVPATILSRVQKFTLRKITIEELVSRLRQIAKAEGIEADDGALEIVARRGEGSVRDALSILDQIIAFSGRSISSADVATVLGLSDTSFFARLMTLVSEGDHRGIVEALQEAAESGRDFKLLYRDLLSFVRNMLLISAGGKPDVAGAEEVAKKFSYSELLRIANLLMRDDDVINRAEHQRLAVEIALLKAATFPRMRAVEEVLSGSAVSQPRGPAVEKEKPRETAQPRDLDTFLERIQKARPAISAYIANAKSTKNGDTLSFTFNDTYSADAVTNAREFLESIAREVYGAPVTISVETTAPPPSKEKPIKEDPVLKAFQKHLGGEVVETRRTK
ncbi:MAG: DNA polymerase III subunit gamma/tau [Acidobacteriota bacterium]|nr:DNA polymerase III subunit gamma/tau [Acidobacteriota bacterium]